MNVLVSVFACDFFSCIFWANNLIILCYSDWNEKKKERIKVLCRKRMKFKQLSMCCEAKLFRVLFFLFVRLFLTFFWSILIHGCRLATEKKRLDDVQKIWHKYDKTKQSRSEHTLAKKCWNKQKTIFFFCKNCWPIPSLFAPWAKFLW